MADVSAVPLAHKKREMPPAGKSSTGMQMQSAGGDEITRLHNTLSALTIDKEMVSSVAQADYRYSWKTNREGWGRPRIDNR